MPEERTGIFIRTVTVKAPLSWGDAMGQAMHDRIVEMFDNAVLELHGRLYEINPHLRLEVKE